MSTEVTEEIKEPLIFMVKGANWSSKVVVDGINIMEVTDKSGKSQPFFNLETQMVEAATRALEIFYGIKIQHKNGQVENINPHAIDIMLNEGEKEPIIGPMIYVCPLNGDPAKDYLLIPTHIVLADGGFVKQSMSMFGIFTKQLEELNKETQKAQAKLDGDIKKLEKLQRTPTNKTLPRKYTKKKKK